MIANITGMICDGAKPISGQEGVVDEDVDQTVRNMSEIGKPGMMETDKVVLGIKTNKKQNRN